MKGTAVLALAAVGVAPSSVAAQEIRKGVLEGFVSAIKRKDTKALDRASGVALLMVKSLTPEKFDYDIVPPSVFFDTLKGCIVTTVAAQYGEAIWTCQGQLSEGRKCFDVAYVATVKLYGANTVARLQKSDSWSTKRCGKSPIFVPAPPPLPPTKSATDV